MPFEDIDNATTYTGFADAEEANVRSIIETFYNGSATAATMLDNWVAAGNDITVNFSADSFNAALNTGTINIDPDYIANLYYIDPNGNSVQYDVGMAIAHEFVHSIEGLLDNWDATDYAGDTVIFTNDIHDEMGIAQRLSYIGTNFDDVIMPGYAYTDGAAIERAVAFDADFSAVGDFDDLLIGGGAGNALEAGAGNDFVFGGGGDDNMNGGLAGSDTVVFDGSPTDYDLRLNDDGTWTSRHVRGDADEGTDTAYNFEQVMFEGGETFNLAKGGLTYQTDFAFVVDQTGSMSDDIAAVQAAATGVIDALFLDDTIDARVGVVGFRDNTIGQPTEILLGFTDQDDFADRKTAALDAINALGASGGGDFPETAYDGLLKALDGSMGEWREGAGVKKIALFTDASAKDASIAGTVLAYALDIGATITASSSAPLSDMGTVDTFELSLPDEEALTLFPEADGEGPPAYVPTGEAVEAPGSTAMVQITTIFIDSFITPDPDLTETSELTGGSVLVAENAAEVVERLLEVVNSANYVVGVDASAVPEGDDGTTEITFSITRRIMTTIPVFQVRLILQPEKRPSPSPYR